MSSSGTEPNGSPRGADQHRDSADSSASTNQHLLMVASLYDEIEQQRKSSISFDKIKQISLTYSLQSEDEPTSLDAQNRNSGATHRNPTSYVAFDGLVEDVEPARKSRAINQEAAREAQKLDEKDEPVLSYIEQEYKPLRYNSLEPLYDTIGEKAAQEFDTTGSCIPARHRPKASSNCSIKDSSDWNGDFEKPTQIHRYRQAERESGAPVIGIKLGQHQVSLSFNQEAAGIEEQLSTRLSHNGQLQVCGFCSRTDSYVACSGCGNNLRNNCPNRDENVEPVRMPLPLPRHGSPIDRAVKNIEQTTYDSRPTSEMGYAYRLKSMGLASQTTDWPLNEATGRMRAAPEVGSQEYSEQAEERRLSLSPGSKLSGLIEELSLNLNGNGGGGPITVAGGQLNDIDYSLASGSSCCSSDKRRAYVSTEEPTLFCRSPVHENMHNCNGARLDSSQRAASVGGACALNLWEQSASFRNDVDNRSHTRGLSSSPGSHRFACSSSSPAAAATRCEAPAHCRARASLRYMGEEEEEEEYVYDEYPARIDIVIKSPQKQMRASRRRPQLEQCNRVSKMSPSPSPPQPPLRQWQLRDQLLENSPIMNNNTMIARGHLKCEASGAVSPVEPKSEPEPEQGPRSWHRRQQEPAVDSKNLTGGCGAGTAPKQLAHEAPDFNYNQISLEAKGKQLAAFNVVEGGRLEQVKPSKSLSSATQAVEGRQEPACVRVALHQCGSQLDGRYLAEVGVAATPAVVSAEAATGKAIKIKDDQPVVVRGAPSEQVEPCSSIDTSTKQQQQLSGAARETQTPDLQLPAMAQKKDGPLFAAPKYLSGSRVGRGSPVELLNEA